MAKHSTPFVEHTIKVFIPMPEVEWQEFKSSKQYQVMLRDYLREFHSKHNGGKPNECQ